MENVAEISLRFYCLCAVGYIFRCPSLGLEYGSADSFLTYCGAKRRTKVDFFIRDRAHYPLFLSISIAEISFVIVA